MDDFLHNLRSGKLKQHDRGRRDYTDYKGPQRRTSNERRRPDYYTKVTNENFALIKETLDVLAKNQHRIADAVVTNTAAVSRVADALESIATMMGPHLGIERNLSEQPETATVEPNREEAGITGENQNTEVKPKLLDIISTMRMEGDSWEKIARYIDDQGIPTVSGKGKWRGTAIKKFWDANVQDIGS